MSLPGFRTHRVILVTTLLDRQEFRPRNWAAFTIAGGPWN